jgi:hypothetical protein
MTKSLSLAIVLVILSSYSTAARAPITFEERVKAQEAIERVYYAHRIWPKENPQPKPPFEEMVPRALIEAKVTDSLKKCVALDKYWQRPIQPEQLQAEMDRMAKGTKDLVTLQELFTALGDDPYLIAECLARPVLADRLLQNWYAFDTRFHSEVREQVERARDEITPGTVKDFSLGDWLRTTYRPRSPGEVEHDPTSTGGTDSLNLDPDEFVKVRQELPHVGVIGFKESPDAFVLTLPITVAEAEMTLVRAVFRKTSIGEWWKNQEPVLSLTAFDCLGSHVMAFSLPRAESTCTGQWLAGAISWPGVPDARSGHVAVWTGTEMIIWGGRSDHEGYLNSGGRYNPSTDTWTATSTGSNCPEGRHTFTAVWTGTLMIVWGGSGTTVYTSGGRYNPTDDTWATTSTTGNCPVARFGHTAVWTGTRMIIWGGSPLSPYVYGSGGLYDPFTDGWTATAEGPEGRISHTAVWTDTYMIVWGGIRSNGEYLYSGSRYNPSTNTWLATANWVSEGRNYHSAVWTGTEMIVWGGHYWAEYHDYYLANGARYNPSTNTWTAMGGTPPAGRTNPTAVWTGNEMVVWGGSNGSGALNTGGRYNPTTNTWFATSTAANCPTARGAYTVVWADNEMIIWGGSTGADTHTGGRYSPGTDSWVATSTGAGSPEGRNFHSTVWTGTEMVVWGGTNGSTQLNTGGRYSPSSDSWTATSTDGECPSGRRSHKAVWTGTEMILWGGITWLTPSTLVSGGRYNPIADTWAATSEGENCPSARYEYTSVWTGTEMVVWGGYYASGGPTIYLNSGGRYSPGSNVWTATSIEAPCPTGRWGHTTIWSGTEMLVWGGNTSGGYVNTGGRYVPSSNSWTALASEPNCPSARVNHTAIWTGEEMIIWGGSTSPIVNTGGRYKPSTDSWLPTSTGENCPVGRAWCSAVWADGEMIIWGGGDGSGYDNSGGRYTSATDSWFATPIDSHCPSARQQHTAIWTGTEMIVWGGYPRFLHGGIYRPGVIPPVVQGASERCAGEIVTLSTGTYTTYHWILDDVDISGATNQTYDASVSGTYAVRVTDSIGCEGLSQDHPLALDADPAPSVSPTAPTMCSGMSTFFGISASGTALSYQWRKGGTPLADTGHFSGATTETLQLSDLVIEDSGSYDCLVTNGGCTVTSPSVSLSVYACGVPSMTAEPAFTAGTTNQIGWQAVQNATGYEAQVSADGFGSVLQSSGIIADTAHLFSGLQGGGAYQYRVKALFPWGESTWSMLVNSTQDADIPSSAISNPLSGAILYGGIWNAAGTASDGTSGVSRVELSWDNGATWHIATGTTSWSYSWTLPADGNYTLLVRGTDSASNVEAQHGFPVIVRNRPMPPTSLMTQDVPFDGGWVISLSWTLSGDDGAGLNYIIGYGIYRAGAASGPFSQIGFVPSGTGSYEDATAGTGVNRWYRVRAITDADVWPNYADSEIIGPIVAHNEPPLPVNNLQGDLTSGCNVRLTWIESPSPDVLLYNIYYDAGTGTVNYAVPLASVSSPATTWVSSGLALNQRFIFAIRAKDLAGQEDGLTSNRVSIVTACSLVQPSAEISQPQAGRKIQGQNVTVIATLIRGTRAETQDVRFQWRNSGGIDWYDIIPNGNGTDENPDPSYPYLLHWDITEFSTGNYDIRAVASSLLGAPDPEPPFVTVIIVGDSAQIKEDTIAGDHIATYETYRGSGNRNVTGFDRDGTQLQLTVPKGSLPATIQGVTVRDQDPAQYFGKTAKGFRRGRGESVPLGNLTSAGTYRVVSLQGGQTRFNAGVELIFFFHDENGDGILDGTDIPITQLDAFREVSAGQWELQNTNRTLDTVNRYLRITVTDTGTFGLFSYPKPAVVVNLHVTRTGNDAVLTWDPVTQDEKGNALAVDHYNIYAGTNPGYYPDLIAQTNRLGFSATVTYTNTGACNDGAARYYLVTAVDGPGRESYPR